MKNRNMEIAETILGQIKYLDKKALPKSKEVQGGLRFKVNDLRF